LPHLISCFATLDSLLAALGSVLHQVHRALVGIHVLLQNHLGTYILPFGRRRGRLLLMQDNNLHLYQDESSMSRGPTTASSPTAAVFRIMAP
jgi:hypothetical protein